MKENRKIDFSYPKKVEFISILREDLQKALSGDGISHSRLNDLTFILNEMFTNFLRHSVSPAESLFRYEVSLFADKLQLIVTYIDQEYSEIKLLPPRIEELPVDGYGLFMASKMSREMKIEYLTREKLLKFTFLLAA
ncbi:MAG: hypothetical protein PHW04_07555 [Candidatus Wallbacteria bacterium]|nr:hypothetical protein [Candidatus Wallbacteria bacterium]